MEILSILIAMVVACKRLHVFVKIHSTIYLNKMNFTLCILLFLFFKLLNIKYSIQTLFWSMQQKSKWYFF